MPVRIAVLCGDEVFAGPAAELEFADEIDIGKSRGDHENRVLGSGNEKNPSVN